MLGIVLDIGCGYLIAKKVNNVWLAMLAAVVGGIIIAVGVNMLSYSETPDPAAAGEIMKKLASGVMLNPLIILAALMLFRKRYRSSL